MEIDETATNTTMSTFQFRPNMSTPADEATSLAALLGRESSACLSKPSGIPVMVDWAAKSKTKDGSALQTDDVEKIVEEILNPAKVKTVLQFNKACKVFLEKSPTALDPSSRTSLGSLILNSVAERSNDKTQKQLWPKKSLLKIIEECNVAASSCSSFVQSAIGMKDIDVVRCCVDHMQDIPDYLLTKVLLFYIRHFQGISSNENPESTESIPSLHPASCPVSSVCAQCVNKVLCCPFNDTFIIDNLRQFSFDEAMVLLRYLHFLLSITSASDQDDCIPTLNIVADWISALLDAHFTQLLLSHEARELLAELAQSVQVQESFYTELEAVKTILQSFKDSVSVPVKQQSGSYSIEVLCI
ncbi:nucleolar protein 11-like [Patiria miniata]|uniref:Nucleolar protein 11 C-terminal domain-containing protein n=1 Tax=Patiria miniata TaxID=46514 RepID=A0A914AZ76_PATMI|nr:nucleolar protein 11-like [Patiria miniata]